MMTSYDVIVTSLYSEYVLLAGNNDDVIKKIIQNDFLSLDIIKTNKMRASRLLYRHMLKSYYHFYIMTNFDDVIMIYDVTMTSLHMQYYNLKPFMPLYDRPKFHPSSIRRTLFSEGGGHNGPPQTFKDHRIPQSK